MKLARKFASVRIRVSAEGISMSEKEYRNSTLQAATDEAVAAFMGTVWTSFRWPEELTLTIRPQEKNA